MNYKLSVIIPTYNAEDYLLEAVESVKKQTLGFENIELILVDDNSNDNTKTILKDLSSKYENIKSILLDGNSGTASKPRNEGIKASTTDYIMFLDNDDIYYPEMCERMYNTIIDEDCDVVSCRYNIDSEESSKTPHSFLNKYDNYIKINSINEFEDLMTLGHPTMIWTKLFRKSMILNNNIEFPEGYLYEDVYFCVKSYLHANGIVLLNDFWGYGYQLRTEGENKSTCQVFSQNMLEKQFRGFLKLMDLIGNDYNRLKSELIIDMTKIYIYADIDKTCENEFLAKMKPFYKNYKISTKVYTAGIPFNLVINIFIKLFATSNGIARFASRAYKKLR